MRYLRMLSNSVIAAGVASGYLTALVLQLNPSISIDPATLLPLALVLGVAYGANLTVAFYALIVMRQILAVEVLSPGWLSVRLLSWLCTIAAGAAAALMWLNLRGFGDVLDPITRDRMFVGAALVTASAVIFLGLGLAHLGRRGGRISAAILSTTMVLSVAAPIVARGPARQPPVPVPPPATVVDGAASASDSHIRMLMFDGASLDVILSAVAAGRLPNIARIIDQGSVLHLATLRPTQAEPVWSAIATGRYPMSNGVRSAVVYRVLGGTPIQLLPDYCFTQALVTFGFLTEQPQTATDLLARPIWNILSDRGASVGVIGWPLTHPAPAVNGFVVSDAFHRLPETELSLGFHVGALAARSAGRRARGAADAGRSRSGVAGQRDGRAAAGQRLRRAQRPGPDRRRSRAPPVIGCARSAGAAIPGGAFSRHRCGGTSLPALRGPRRVWRRVGGRARAVWRRTESVLRISRHAGRPRNRAAGSRTICCSWCPRSGWSRCRQASASSKSSPAIRRSAARTSARLTVLCSPLVANVAPGRPPRASVVDLAPTILYFLGLPVGRDMDGFARIDLFKPAFTSDKPVTYIPSYGR